MLLSRSVSPSVEHLARAAREDLHLRASVIMQVSDPAVSASQPDSRNVTIAVFSARQ